MSKVRHVIRGLRTDCLSLFLLIGFSIQQTAVLGNLPFQPHLEVQQQVVLGLLLLDGHFELLQLHLQVVDGQLQLAELIAVPHLGVGEVLAEAFDLDGGRGNE